MNGNEILIVDDDGVIRTLFERAFGRAGYEVTSAASAESALSILEKKDFQVMFLDMKLPEMNGLELCKKIKKDKPSAVIFAMTAYVSMFELSDCFDAGFDDYFTKPVNIETLFKAVAHAFNGDYLTD